MQPHADQLSMLKKPKNRKLKQMPSKKNLETVQKSNRRRVTMVASRVSIVALALMTLNACGKSGADLVNKLKAQAQATAQPIEPGAIPDLKPEDARKCPDPAVPEGVDEREIIADHRVVLGDCRRRHQRVVKQYQDVQKGHRANEGKPK